MNWIDYIILAVIIFSALISLMRGFFRESLSLVTWICAFMVAGHFYPYISDYISFFQDEFAKNACAVALLFIATLLVGAIVNYVIYRLVNYTGLSGLDRLLGVFFGILRGVLIIAAILFGLDAFTSLAQSAEWAKSTLIPHFNFIIQWFFDYLQHTSTFLGSTTH